MMNQKTMARRGRAGLIAMALAGMALSPIALAKQTNGTDWLWLSSQLVPGTCTFTTTVTWQGFKNAKTLEVFVTQGYAGSKLIPTYVQVQNKTNTATVTLGPLAAGQTLNQFYPWAQLLDSHGVAIPASLDFSGEISANCSAP